MQTVRGRLTVADRGWRRRWRRRRLIRQNTCQHHVSGSPLQSKLRTPGTQRSTTAARESRALPFHHGPVTAGSTAGPALGLGSHDMPLARTSFPCHFFLCGVQVGTIQREFLNSGHGAGRLSTRRFRVRNIRLSLDITTSSRVITYLGPPRDVSVNAGSCANDLAIPPR